MYPLSAPVLAALSYSRTERTVVEVWRGGVRLAEDLNLEDGTVTDQSAPGVRRQVDLAVTRRPGVFDMLAPTGTLLRPYTVLELPGMVPVRIPMGVFDIDSESLDYAPGPIAVNGSDKFVKLQRAEFLLPQASMRGATIGTQIAILVKQALGPDEPVVDLTGSDARVGSLVWEGDRAKVINELAASIGAWFYFDRNGTATIAPLPTYFPGAGVWSVTAGEGGVLLAGSRSVDRSDAFNVVIASTERGDGAKLFDPVMVWDDDPASPTYAGTDPRTGANVGPFGIVPERISSPLLENWAQAFTAARARLLKGIGIGSQLRLTGVRNAALDCGDPIGVAMPRERWDIEPATGIHLADKISHPLTPDGVQAIETRSTYSPSGVQYVPPVAESRPPVLAGGFGTAPFGTTPFGGSS